MEQLSITWVDITKKSLSIFAISAHEGVKAEINNQCRKDYTPHHDSSALFPLYNSVPSLWSFGSYWISDFHYCKCFWAKDLGSLTVFQVHVYSPQESLTIILIGTSAFQIFQELTGHWWKLSHSPKPRFHWPCHVAILSSENLPMDLSNPK